MNNSKKNDLDKILKEKAPKSIDELLSYLPDEYKKYNTMMFQSNSGQKSSLERPRMILFGKDALILKDLEEISFLLFILLTMKCYILKKTVKLIMKLLINIL
jgi:hypothetical protein